MKQLTLIAHLLFLTSTIGNAADWEIGPGYRRLKVEPVGSGKDGFTLLSPEKTGILFTNKLAETRGLASQILPSGWVWQLATSTEMDYAISTSAGSSAETTSIETWVIGNSKISPNRPVSRAPIWMRLARHW